jgi:hypothetical protein
MTRFAPERSGYEIEDPAGVCALTGRRLEPGESYMASLVELDAEQQQAERERGNEKAAVLGLKRMDVSLEAWEAGQRPEKLFGYWKSRIPEPKQKKQKVFVDAPMLMNLLERLAGTKDARRQAFRFVIALILMRKKLLRYDGSSTETGEEGETLHWWKLTPKADVRKGPLSAWDEQNPIAVRDPRLDERQIREVCDQLGEILEADL